VSTSQSRYDQFLTKFKLRYFETVSTITVLILFTAFVVHELRPVIASIWAALHGP